jgi:hypothetical protein
MSQNILLLFFPHHLKIQEIILGLPADPGIRLDLSTSHDALTPAFFYPHIRQAIFHYNGGSDVLEPLTSLCPCSSLLALRPSCP